MKKIVTVVIAIVMLLIAIITIQPNLVFAKKLGNYGAGFAHGQDDCKLPPSQRYINQPGKGSIHTDEFMNGYNDAINSCSSSRSSSYDAGFKSGVAKAHTELDRFNADTTGKATIAGDVSPPCPSTDLEFCRGFHDAWSKTVIGELD